MPLLSKEYIRTLIKENNITTGKDIHTTLKNMFKDILQEMLEAELDDDLGYARYDAQAKTIDNSRNGYPKKTVRSELGALDLNIPRDRNGGV